MTVTTETQTRDALVARAKLLILNGHGLDDVRAKIGNDADQSEVESILSAAFAVIALGLDPATAMKAKQAQAEDDGYRVVLTPYSEIEAKLTEWVWERRMPRAALALLVGTEGFGKTAVGLRFAADLTRGELPGCLRDTPVRVALLTPEDDASRTIRTRLDAAGADVSRVFDLTMRRDTSARGLSLPGDTDEIMDKLVSADVRFVFADPLASTLDPKINSWKDTDIREALEPFVLGCSEHDITLLGALHTNKSKSTDPRQRGMGSVGWRQVARASFLVGLDPDDEDSRQGSTRCIGHDKHNLGPWTKTLRFGLKTKPIMVEGRRQDTVYADLGDECDVTTDQMLAAEAGIETEERKGKVGKAAGLLETLLASGAVSVTRIKGAAEDEGIGWRTMERAADKIGVRKRQLEGTGGHVWELQMAL